MQPIPLEHLADLRPSPFQAIIINVSTKLVSTLALLSTLQYADMPVLVIDCESSDGSWEHFRKLKQTYDFDLLSAPLRSHGATLDWLFAHIPVEHVLLVDSDLEILGPDIVSQMRAGIAEPAYFGSGILHAGAWMTEHKQPFGYYVERPWIPLTLLKTKYIREALDAGLSFKSKTVHNEFPPSPLISRMLIKRFRLPIVRHWRIALLDVFRREFQGKKPAFMAFDTGAILYQYLRYDKGYHFAGLPWDAEERFVRHYHGVTRLLLNRKDHNGTPIHNITKQVYDRLRDEYSFSFQV